MTLPPTLDDERDEASATPSSPGAHLVALGRTRWQVWRSAVLRGAGFPAEMVGRLAGTHAAAAARTYLAARERRVSLVTAFLDNVRAMRPTDRSARRWRQAMTRKLAGGRVDPALLSSADAPWPPEERARLAAAVEDEQRAFATLAAAYETDTHAIDEGLTAMLADARVREAILWQNPPMLSYATTGLHRSGARRRRAREFLAMLAQRLAVKNDTYAFFGPVAWADVGGAAGYVRQQPGASLTASHAVYFEGWAIDALAETFNREAAVRRWSAPRLASGTWIGPDGLYTSRSGPLPLSDVERHVLSVCDGVRTAEEIAAHASADGAVDVDATEVLDVLSRYAAQGLLAWQFEVPSQLHPQQELERRIARIGDPTVRQRYAASLRSLTDARDELAACHGDPERLERCLESLGTMFTDLTGCAPTRHHGRMYAARSLVYQDCRRGGTVVFGRAFLERLGPPLAVVLDGVRWLVGEVALAATEALRECHGHLRTELARDVIPAEIFLSTARDAAWRQAVWRRVPAIERRFQDKWREVLGEPISAQPHRQTYEVASAQARAARVFEPRAEGWGLARHISPDIMVAATGPAAFERGNFSCVLGELHCSNTARWSAVVSQHAAPESLVAAVQRDAGAHPLLVVQTPKSEWLARMNTLLIPATAWRYESEADPPNLPVCRPLPAGALVAVEENGIVRLRARDGSFACDAIEVFGLWLSPLTSRLAGRFRPGSTHAPRVVLGDLVVSRECWTMTAAETPFVLESDAIARFAAVAAWRQEHRIPRWAFYKTPDEPKPVYVDFDSPLYVDVFIKLVKHMQNERDCVRIVEMLPRADERWLVDGGHVRYTSELRLVLPVPPARAGGAAYEH